MTMMLMILRNVNYCGLPGNSVLATMVTVYGPLTISNTFSKRRHKPCNTSKHVKNGTILEILIKFLVRKCMNKNKRVSPKRNWCKYLSIWQKSINNIFHPFDIIEFPLSLQHQTRILWSHKFWCDFSLNLLTWNWLKNMQNYDQSPPRWKEHGEFAFQVGKNWREIIRLSSIRSWRGGRWREQTEIEDIMDFKMSVVILLLLTNPHQKMIFWIDVEKI